MNVADRVVELGVLPDPVLRAGIRANLGRRLRRERRRGQAARHAFLEELRRSPIAARPAKPNEQHYQLPPEFFRLVLGPRMKYSACLWEGARTLAEAEEAMLALTCERARIEDGMEILDLGCGWGSLTFWLAERYPRARVVALSNSRLQREFIEARGAANVEVVTADVNQLALEGRFDRIVSVEMFEHMRNYERLLAELAGLLREDGLLFVHLFCHRDLAYAYEDGWMARRFFTAGTMPSADLLLAFQRDLVVLDRWLLSGRHYARTAAAWRERLDSRREEAVRELERAYGPSRAGAWLANWRVFFLACEELWGYRGGDEWLVAHYLLGRPGASTSG